MNTTNKSLAAAFTAVLEYIFAEEEALLMLPPKKPTPRTFEQGNLWGVFGRQDIMQMRSMAQMKVPNR